MACRFVGVDLSWKCAPFKEGATAVCSCGQDGKMDTPELVTSDDDVIEFIGPGPAWIGIDASLLVPNQFGLRSGEREIVRSRH